MNCDELMERIAEVFSQTADTLETIAKEIEKAKERAEAVEKLKTSSVFSRTMQAFPGKPTFPTGGRLWEISVAAAMREHTAVTGQ